MTVVVRGLTKRFGGSDHAAAANGVTFEAPAGKVTALLGPSGSGKTTVLRMIAGLEEPDAGTVTVDGVDTTRVPARLRNVGFVFQGYALFNHMTVRDNVAFGMSIRGAPRKDQNARVDELLSLIQLAGYDDRYPRELSGGQRQRVALARALATNPKVLLLDEPFGALDARVRTGLREWLTELHEKTRVTTLLVTHDQDEAFELSSHVVLLHEGKVVQAGEPHELYDRPATPFVASFLGSANVLHGRVENGRAALGSLALAVPEGSRDGASVQAFVRPHDVRIEKTTDADADAASGAGRGAGPEGDGGDAAPASSVLVARIERLTRIGRDVKLALRLASGDPMTVKLTKAELDDLGVQEGDRVLVDYAEAKVFVEDYSI